MAPLIVQPSLELSGHACYPEEVCLQLGCHENADCNKIDSESADSEYNCECKNGYVGDGTTACDDIDECDGAMYPCGENGSCKNTDGSFTCSCAKGYEDITGVCVDIDECKDGGHVCDINAYCYNVPGKNFSVSNMYRGAALDDVFNFEGSFGCGPCKSGYSKTCTECFVGMCSNIDECLDSAACDSLPGSSCFDTPGHFECICPIAEYRGTCISHDECSKCNSDAICIVDETQEKSSITSAKG